MPEAAKCGDRILEVIVCSVADALEAEQGGADRLEIVRDLDRGGMTPGLNLVRSIRREVSLPLRVMLRESEDNCLHRDGTFHRLCAMAFELQQIGVDGIVAGFLHNKGADMEMMHELLDTAPRLCATFHHAFDEAESPVAVISQLKKIAQIDCVLTSGGSGTLLEQAANLELYRQQALDEITILAGGGLNEEAIRFLCARTGIREFHIGRAARFPHHSNGVVRAELVERLRRILSDDNCLVSESSGSIDCAHE